MKESIYKYYNYFFNAESILHSKRLPWIDYAKGLTIILVVYHHSFLTLINAGVPVNNWLINANLSVYSFRMPMFFILSGLFIEKSLSKRNTGKYIKSRAAILLYPYILWALMQATLGIFFSQYFHSGWGVQRYWAIFYQPNDTSQLWYLVTLFNTALLYTILRKEVGLNNNWQLFIGILLYLGSPFLYFNSMIQDTTRFYVYIVFGSLISNFILDKKNMRYFNSIKLLIPLSILMFISQYHLFKHQDYYKLEMYFNLDNLSIQNVAIHFLGMIQFCIIVLIGCAFVLNICALLQRFKKFRFIEVVGYHSLYIYLMHVLIIVAIRLLIVNMFHYKNVYVILPIQILFGMILPVIFFNICKHLNLLFLFQYKYDDHFQIKKNEIILNKSEALWTKR